MAVFKMVSPRLHATIRSNYQVRSIPRHTGGPGAPGAVRQHPRDHPKHLWGMSNHTIAAPITSWAELRSTDREVLNRSEVAALLEIDARTLDHAIDDGTIP